MKIQIRDIKYHVRKFESRQVHPWIVLLHGFMGSGRCFDFLTSHLKDWINVITVDLLGHGKTQSAPDKERFHTDEQLADLDQLLRQTVPGPYFLYGYSMGGRLAMRYAARQPESIVGLILESTHEGIQDSKTRKKRRQIDRERARRINMDFSGFLDWWQNLDLFQLPDGIPEKREKHYRNVQQRQNPRQMAMSLRGFGQGIVVPVPDELEELGIPVLLGAGKHDKKYVERMKKMRQILPNPDLEIISRAAHRIHLDAPETWSNIIKEFIAKHY